MIFFREADHPCKVLGKKRIASWLSRVVESHSKTLGDVCVVSCTDKYILDINKQHLDHDYYTDIITFDYSENSVIAGDLIISFDRVKENARENGVGFQDELKRVMVHGCLHLCGFNDKTKAQEKNMRLEENKALEMFHVEQ